MKTDENRKYPGGSKSLVSRAGDHVRKGIQTAEDLRIIDTWRAAHRSVLNTFQAILRMRTRGTNIIVAQRHKRKNTIFDKLKRLPNIQLARMDDIVGCRLIFQNINELYEFRKKFHKARFKHERQHKDNTDKYDYIKSPKATGYRGVHDVYSYNVNSKSGKDCKGLLIEIQYRTIHQHAWATCVEVIGFITESNPKFQRGDPRYERFMALASELIARKAEEMTSCLPTLTDTELLDEFLKLDKELNILQLLRNLKQISKEIKSNKNVILIYSEEAGLEMKSYTYATDALKELFELEEANQEKDIVLIRSNKGDDARIAFKNYFADAGDFIKLIDNAHAAISFSNAPEVVIPSKP